MSTTLAVAEPRGAPAPSATERDDYRELTAQARQAGLFESSSRRAILRLTVLAVAYGAGWYALSAIGRSWYELLVAFYLAAVFTQVAFLGHDVGHRQFCKSRRLNTVVGLLCGNLFTGISYGFWVCKHNQHHAHPNEVGADPDVGPGVISWTAEQAATKTGLGRAIARHQAGLFFPLASLEAFSLHVSSTRSLTKKRGGRARCEAALLTAHFLAYFGALALLLSPLRAIAFIVVQQGVFGLYLACAFAPNHKGMVMPRPGQCLGFVRRQVTTSRNVRGGRVLTAALGGLNYQIEHHLFPGMPMSNLRRCQPIVQAYCLTNDIDYCESALIASYRAALRHLADASALVDG